MHTDPLLTEKRKKIRYEPTVNASINNDSDIEVTGILLNISQSGLAVDFSQEAPLPKEGDIVDVTISSREQIPRKIHLGSAMVMRVWYESSYYDKGKGVSLCLNNEINAPEVHRMLLQGPQQYHRLNKQHAMISYDLNHLSAYRCSLSECQVKLFIHTITLSIMLATTYFALNYYGHVKSISDDNSIRFWRTLFAALPGLITIIFGFVISQKNSSIQRVDAYVAVIKECLIKNRIPKEYRGWETESYKFRQIMKTDACRECEMTRKCGTLTSEDQIARSTKKLFRNPTVDIYYVVLYGTLYSILILSTLALLLELYKYKLEINTYFIVISAITAFMAVSAIAIGYMTHQLRVGRLSLYYYRRCWLDLLGRCRKSVCI